MQELNLNYKYNPLYWQTANLVVESGSMDMNSNDSNNYGKTAVAIALSQKQGVNIGLPLINEAEYGFIPDIDNNRIIFGLKGINGINSTVSQLIMENRPYTSITDFAEKLLDTKLIKTAQMLQLIKGGCFTELHSPIKTETMKWFLKNYEFKPCTNLTMSQYNKMTSLDVIPDELKHIQKLINFKNYVLDDEGLFELYINENKKVPKCGYHDRYFILDENSQEFFVEHFTENSVIKIVNGFYVISEKKFIKEIDSYIQPLKDWFQTEDALNAYNNALYAELWKENADGNENAWSMKALNYYDKEHELEYINEEKYGIVNFFDLPEEPPSYETYIRYINKKPMEFPKYVITRIAGTVINFDNNHHTIHLLTKYGCVPVKFDKGSYAFYNKRISVKLDENSNKKTVLENSWFSRSTKLIITGIRQEQNFKPKRYADTIYQHTVNRITEIYDDGTMLIQSERVKI